ncbi:MAG TPA: hypothetical protein VF895_10415 [Gaiellaceae bacterium]
MFRPEIVTVERQGAVLLDRPVPGGLTETDDRLVTMARMVPGGHRIEQNSRTGRGRRERVPA